MKRSTLNVAFVLVCAGLVPAPFAFAASSAASKDAQPETKQANAAVLKQLNFGDREDFEDAQRGLIATPANAVIKDSSGRQAWNLNAYDFLKQ